MVQVHVPVKGVEVRLLSGAPFAYLEGSSLQRGFLFCYHGSLMKCEICHENESSVVLKQVVDGSVREVAICPVCAAANSLGLDLGKTPFPEPARADEATEPSVCPACGVSVSDLRRRSRLGCEHCYVAFNRQLVSLLTDMQPATQHAGRIPAVAKMGVERHALAARLSKAIAMQEFETAATMRDRIAELDRLMNGDPHGAR